MINDSNISILSREKRIKTMKRRSFLRNCALTGAGLHAATLYPLHAGADDAPMSIVQCESNPDQLQGLSDQVIEEINEAKDHLGDDDTVLQHLNNAKEALGNAAEVEQILTYAQNAVEAIKENPDKRDQYQSDLQLMLDDAVEAVGIAKIAKSCTRKAVEAVGGISKFVKEGDVVWVKPNIGWNKQPRYAANTNPDVVATLVEMCLEAGAREVVVSDRTCNKQELTFANSGIEDAAKKAGATVFFLDPRKLRVKQPIDGKVLDEWEVYPDVLEADVFINVPITKHHGLSTVTLSMKNLMGIIGGARNRYHQDIDNTLADLASFAKPNLIVTDAVRVLMDHGPIGGNLSDVKQRNVVMAGTDPVAMDAFATTLLNRDPKEIGHIKEAEQRGLGTMDYTTLNPQEITI